MNENFKIPDQSSLFNIKNLYNQFIEHIGNDGFENIIINPDMTKLLIDSSNNQQKAAWEFENVSIPWGSYYYGLSTGSYIRQDICPKLDDNVYTIVLDIKITGNLVMQLYGHQVGINQYEPSIIDLDNPTPENPIQGLFKTIEPRFDEFGNPIRFQVAFSFSASSIPNPLRTAWLTFIRDTEDVNVKFYNVSITKGMFAVNMDKKQCFFTDYVRYNIFDKAYEVSMDGGENYYRLFTSRPEDIDEIVNILVTNDIIYTAADCDLMFLRKDIPDAAERLITFLEGLKSEQDVNLDEAAKLILDGGKIIVNNAQTGTPDRPFSLMVTRGFERDVGIRYNETIDKWQFTHDGIDWKILGSGTGTGGTGTGSSELEYYAEILNRSGFKYGYYDLFDEVDQADSVINYNDNLNWSGDYSLYKVEDNPTGPWILTTKNVWNPDHAGNTYTFFAHCLTNKPDNAGIIASYSLVGSGGGEPLLENDPGWISFNLNEFVSPTANIDELYFRFELASDDIEFHSFGVFYGVWDYTMGSYTRLREYYVSPNDQGFNASIQVPNGASYTVGEKALELYVNRVRQILDTDYHETDPTHVEMLVPINAGDVIEFYEKFGYADFSQSNEDLIYNHIADTDAHWDATEMSLFSTHISDTSIHFPSTTYDNHINDTNNPHSVTITQIGAADVNHNHDTDYLGLHATADDSNTLGGKNPGYYEKHKNLLLNSSFEYRLRSYRVSAAGHFNILTSDSKTVVNHIPLRIPDMWYTCELEDVTSIDLDVSVIPNSDINLPMDFTYRVLLNSIAGGANKGISLARQVLYNYEIYPGDYTLSYWIKGVAGAEIKSSLGISKPFENNHICTGGWDFVVQHVTLNSNDLLLTKSYLDTTGVYRTLEESKTYLNTNNTFAHPFFGIGEGLDTVGEYQLANVKLEKGDEATDYQKPLSGDNMNSCSAYFQFGYYFESAYASSQITNEKRVSFYNRLIAYPSVEINCEQVSSNLTNPSVIISDNNGFTIRYSSSNPGGDTAIGTYWSADCEVI